MRNKLLLGLSLLLFLLQSTTQAQSACQISVCFSSDGNCTDAIIKEINSARRSVLIQAYSFTSAPIANALIGVKKRGIFVEAVLGKSREAHTYSIEKILFYQNIPIFFDDKDNIFNNQITIVIDRKTVITGSIGFAKNIGDYKDNLIFIRDNLELVYHYEQDHKEHRSHSYVISRSFLFANDKSNPLITALKILKEYYSLVLILVSSFSALLSLYLGVLKEWLRRPKLKLYFDEKKQYPYFHKLPFEKFDQPIDFGGQEIYLFRPGFNARVKVFNIGKSTAKNVQARIEKIVLYKENGKTSVQYYHPTVIKWSGEPNWNSVDIISKSHFFLDLFWAKNETSEEICSFNNEIYNNVIDKNILEVITKNNIFPSEEIYWNVWVDTSFNRGIPEGYDFEGKVVVHIIIKGENCDPLKFEAIINWYFDGWNQPDIKIKHGRRLINNDNGKEIL